MLKAKIHDGQGHKIGVQLMSIDILRNMLMWSSVINYGILIIWVLFFMVAHDWQQRLLSKWFRLPAGQFDLLTYGSMALFKTGVLLFNLVPYVALRLAT